MPLEQHRELGHHHLIALLRRHPSDREQNLGPGRDRQSLPPAPPFVGTRGEEIDVDAVRDDPGQVVRQAERADPVDELRGAAGEQPRAAEDARRPTREPWLLGHEHVAAVQPDRQRHIPRPRTPRPVRSAPPSGRGPGRSAPAPGSAARRPRPRPGRAASRERREDAPSRRHRDCASSPATRSAAARSGRCGRQRRRRSRRKGRPRRAASARPRRPRRAGGRARCRG